MLKLGHAYGQGGPCGDGSAVLLVMHSVCCASLLQLRRRALVSTSHLVCMRSSCLQVLHLLGRDLGRGLQRLPEGSQRRLQSRKALSVRALCQAQYVPRPTKPGKFRCGHPLKQSVPRRCRGK